MRATLLSSPSSAPSVGHVLGELFPGHAWEWRQAYPGGVLAGHRLGHWREATRDVDLMECRDGNGCYAAICTAAKSIVDELAHPPFPDVDAATYLGVTA